MKPKYTDNRYPHGYRKACETDIRKTFERIKRERKAAEMQAEHNAREALAKVDQRLLRRKAS